MPEDLDFNKDLDVNKVAAEFIQRNIDSFVTVGKAVLKGSANQLRLRFDKTYKSYIGCLLDRYSKAKSFFIRNEPVYLHKFYVPLAVTLGQIRFERPDIVSLSGVSPRLVVTGTAGSGKSMFMRHLFLTCLFAKAKVPIFIELRQLNQTGDTFRAAISRSLRSCRFRLDETYIDAALKAGHFALFLDGFDEIADNKKEAAASAIEEFANLYDANWVIVSSRPDTDLEAWQQFVTAELQPLTLDRACDLVKPLPYDDEIKEKFLEDLQTELFKKHKSFLSNPLLLSIMLLTYGQSAHIPDKLNVFYSTAVQISWAEQRRLLKTREKASPKGCSGDQVAALDKIEIMLLSQLGLHSRQ